MQIAETLNASQVEAVAVADAHLNNAALPTYTSVMTRIDTIAASMRGVREVGELNERIMQNTLKRIRQLVEDGDNDRAIKLINELISA